jgi:hypothetical protein
MTTLTETQVELAVRQTIVAGGEDSAGLRVRMLSSGCASPRRRVRFVRCGRLEAPVDVTITVELEWAGQVRAGSATGPRSAAVELKAAGEAAIIALERLCGSPIGVRVLGVKQVRAFDSEIMVASLVCTDGTGRRMVGAVLVTGDPTRSAALAVLNGLNPLLGNFLFAPG